VARPAGFFDCLVIEPDLTSPPRPEFGIQGCRREEAGAPSESLWRALLLVVEPVKDSASSSSLSVSARRRSRFDPNWFVFLDVDQILLRRGRGRRGGAPMIKGRSYRNFTAHFRLINGIGVE